MVSFLPGSSRDPACLYRRSLGRSIASFVTGWLIERQVSFGGSGDVSVRFLRWMAFGALAGHIPRAFGPLCVHVQMVVCPLLVNRLLPLNGLGAMPAEEP